MDDFSFQKRIKRQMRAIEAARTLLEVREGASREDLKRAWRRACKEHHPDRNPDDREANKRLAAINCAYRLLAFGEPCKMLLEYDKVEHGGTKDQKYNISSTWGYFLWWRKGFFG